MKERRNVRMFKKHNTIYHGDCIKVMKGFPDEYVQTCVTSPPYWGLRKYEGNQDRIWGSDGDGDCEHEWGDAHTISSTDSDTCQLCDAWKGSLGLEPTPEMYVEHLVEIFREVKRVLREDSTLWLNLGDSYATTPPGNKTSNNGKSQRYAETSGDKLRHVGTPFNLPTKNLIGIPWRVAFALQADGWYLRSDIIWAKPNPMPESIKDRPTKSHEYLFLLAKSRKYYYDQDAIREQGPGSKVWGKKHNKDDPYTKEYGDRNGFKDNPLGRNKRTVWTIPPQAFPEAHFATFPFKLVEPCILAGSKQGDIILDPFIGSGTTALAAKLNHRKYIGIDISEEYCKMAEKRLAEIDGVQIEFE